MKQRGKGLFYNSFVEIHMRGREVFYSFILKYHVMLEGCSLDGLRKPHKGTDTDLVYDFCLPHSKFNISNSCLS